MCRGKVQFDKRRVKGGAEEETGRGGLKEKDGGLRLVTLWFHETKRKELEKTRKVEAVIISHASV